MESKDKILQVSSRYVSTVSIPIPIPVSVSTVPTSIEAGTTSMDIAFLINIIRGLENTITALNKRLENYENAMVRESEKMTVKSSENYTESVHENEKPI